MFSNSVEEAKVSAIVYIMAEMAKAQSLNIYGYLKFLLEHRLSKDMTDEQLEELVAWIENSNLSKNACELLQLAKRWSNFKIYRGIIWRLRLKHAHLSEAPQALAKCKDSVERVYLASDINAGFFREGLNVWFLELSDREKSYLAKAMGIQACLNYRAVYHQCEESFETMVALKQADHSKYQKKIRFYLKLDLLILDAFLFQTITDALRD